MTNCVFDDWSSFISQVNNLPEISWEEACKQLQLPTGALKNIISRWRDSTSTSMLHGLFNVSLGKIPKQGSPIFKDLKWQTRFLIMAIKDGLLRIFDVDTKTEKVNDENAKDILISSQKKLNNIVRSLYVYWYLNSRMKIKAPKILYRGIRAHDLYNHDTFKPLIDHVWKSDATREMKRKHAIDILIKFICDKQLHKITDGNLLSFSASSPIAKYFADDKGFVLKVETAKVEIITSELHDERLSGVDFVSGKNEKEYIIRIPEDYAFKPEDIIIHDLDYYVADQNPLCVAYFDHDDKQAIYSINNQTIKARFEWNNSGTSGGIRYMLEGDWYPYSRNDFKKRFGFDPLPTENNLPEITSFKLQKATGGWNKNWKDM